MAEWLARWTRNRTRRSRVQVPARLVESQLVCLPPVGVFGHIMFNLISYLFMPDYFGGLPVN